MNRTLELMLDGADGVPGASGSSSATPGPISSSARWMTPTSALRARRSGRGTAGCRLANAWAVLELANLAEAASVVQRQAGKHYNPGERRRQHPSSVSRPAAWWLWRSHRPKSDGPDAKSGRPHPGRAQRSRPPAARHCRVRRPHRRRSRLPRACRGPGLGVTGGGRRRRTRRDLRRSTRSVERAMAESLGEYPDVPGKRTRREAPGAGRARPAAGPLVRVRRRGAPAQVFFTGVILVDNELAKATNADVAYVLDTLTVPSKTAVAADRAGAARGATGRGGAVPTPSPAPGRPSPPPGRRADARRNAARPGPKPAATTVDAAAAEAASTHSTPPPPVEELKTKAVSGFPDIEGFRIIEQIARGGMGTVYRAHDLQLDIEVAIKVLRSLHPAAQQQFLMEARCGRQAPASEHRPRAPLRAVRTGRVLRHATHPGAGRPTGWSSSSPRRWPTCARRRTAIFRSPGSIPRSPQPRMRSVAKPSKPYYRVVAYWIAGVAEGLATGPQRRDHSLRRQAEQPDAGGGRADDAGDFGAGDAAE